MQNLLKKSIFLALLLAVVVSAADAGYTDTTLFFYPGWNMVSLPLQQAHYVSGCEVMGLPEDPVFNKAFTFYHFNGTDYENAGKLWSSSTTLEAGKGYWIYVTANSGCRATFTGNVFTKFDHFKIRAGWNQVGSTFGFPNLDDVSGSCRIIGGPWEYDPYNKKYGKSNYDPRFPTHLFLARERGYWVFAENDCEFNGPDRIIVDDGQPVIT